MTTRLPGRLGCLVVGALSAACACAGADRLQSEAVEASGDSASQRPDAAGAAAGGGSEAAVSPGASADADAPERAGAEGPHWIDESHAYATHRTQALAQWMDDFFGAEVRDAERADSFVRVIGIDDWNNRDDHDLSLRLRGQVDLPKISERVDLVFFGEENEQTLTEEERERENDVGLRVNFRDSERVRFDATLSVSGGPSLRPGVRARYQQPMGENTWGRLTQRLQYEVGDGYRALTNIDLNHSLNDQAMLRWSARMRFEEDNGFWDWNTGLSYRRWLRDHKRHPSAIEYYVSVSGRDDPQAFNNNYRVGVLYRKQFLRNYLYYEVEPNYNWRRDVYNDDRDGVWGIVLRLEIMLDDDLIGRRRR